MDAEYLQWFIHEENPLKLLNVSSTATAREIHKAYLKMANQIHPDKASAELKNLANVAFQKLGLMSKCENTQCLHTLFPTIWQKIMNHVGNEFKTDPEWAMVKLILVFASLKGLYKLGDFSIRKMYNYFKPSPSKKSSSKSKSKSPFKSKSKTKKTKP